RPDRQDRRHRPRRRGSPPLQRHDPRRARRSGRVVGRALDPRPRGVPAGRGSRRPDPRGVTDPPCRAAPSPRPRWAARAAAPAPVAIARGRSTAAGSALRLAGGAAATSAAAVADLGPRETGALLVALEPVTAERGVRKEIRRSLYRLRQRGVPVPEPERA